jgi:hypothetical protein
MRWCTRVIGVYNQYQNKLDPGLAGHTFELGMRVRTLCLGAMFSVEDESAMKGRDKPMLLDMKGQRATACNPLVMLMITSVAVVVVVVVVNNHAVL